jgi:hypothetical protein
MTKSPILMLATLIPALLSVGCTYYHVEDRTQEAVVVQAPPRPHGPPPWAPAHGHRHKAVYHYYHDCEVYHNVAAGNWFWLERGEWRLGGQLPPRYRRELGPFVIVELEGDRPWRSHEHIRRAHPPRKYDRPERRGGDGPRGRRAR